MELEAVTFLEKVTFRNQFGRKRKRNNIVHFQLGIYDFIQLK